MDDTLLAVSDVLTVKALETVGKRLVRSDRSRFKVLGNRPFYLAHTIWLPDDHEVAKALKGAWSVAELLVERHIDDYCENEVTRVLNEYVHDLCITGTPHSIEELDLRLSTRLEVCTCG